MVGEVEVCDISCPRHRIEVSHHRVGAGHEAARRGIGRTQIEETNTQRHRWRGKREIVRENERECEKERERQRERTRETERDIQKERTRETERDTEREV